tara:strand:- start:5250 stop:5714 length:465 start_codon:yes stop_codon:yes gene_type:complete
MGPAFERSRFGMPLMMLGLIGSISSPENLPGIERELQGAIIDLFSWLIPFSIGTFLVLDSAPNYRKTRKLKLILGWIFISSSWMLLSPKIDSQMAKEITHGSIVLAGLFIGSIPILSGIIIEERISGIRSESEPLSKEEEELVKTILVRRIGGI